MTRRGYIKVPREFFASSAWWREKRKFSKAEALLDMTELASYAARDYVTTKFGTNPLQRGEFILSYSEMRKRWDWTAREVRTFTSSCPFNALVATQRETQAGRVYLLLNYDVEQGVPDETTQQSALETAHLRHTSDTRGSSEAVKQVTKPPRISRYAFMGTVCDFWKKRYGSDPRKGTAKILAPIVEEHGIDETILRLGRYLGSLSSPQFMNLTKFAETNGVYATRITRPAPAEHVMTDAEREAVFAARDARLGISREAASAA
jgi:hypothetical protein